MGDDYTNNPKLGKEVYLKTAKFDLQLEKSGYSDLRRKIYENLSSLDIGRNITVIAKNMK